MSERTRRATWSGSLVERARASTTLRDVFSVSTSRLTFLAGLRCLVGLAVVLGAGLGTGHPTDAVVGSVGALVVGLISYEGLHRATVVGMGLGAVGTALAAFIGALWSTHLGLLLLALAVAGVVASLVAIFGTAVASAALFSIVVLVVSTALPAGPLVALRHALWVMAGGLVETVLVMAFWPLRGAAGEREGLAHSLGELARYATSHPEVPPEADHLLPSAASLADPNPAAPRGQLALIRQLYHVAEDIRILLSALVLELRSEDELAPERQAALEQFLEGVAVRLQATAAVVAPGRRALARRLQHVRASAVPGRPSQRPADVALPSHSAQGLLSARLDLLEDLARRLDEPSSVAGELATSDVATAVDQLVSGTRRRHRARARWGAVVDSGLLGHATRLSVALVVGMLVAREAHVPNGYWVPMTAALVVRNDFSATLERSMGRILGTAAGSGLITLLAAVLSPDRAVLVVLVLVFGLGVYSTSKANYGIYSLSMAATVVSLLALLGLPVGATARERVVATALGGGIALVVFALWPVRKRRLQARALAAVLATEGRYVAAVLAACDPMHRDCLAERRALAAETRAARIKAKAVLRPASPRRPSRFGARARALLARVEIGAHLGLGLEARTLVGDAPPLPAAEALASGIEGLSAHLAARLVRPEERARSPVLPTRSGHAEDGDGHRQVLEAHLGECPPLVARLVALHLEVAAGVDELVAGARGRRARALSGGRS